MGAILDQPKNREPEARETEPRNRPHLRISLLDGFRLEDEGPTIILPEGSQRLLAFLALKGRSIRRPVVAGTLWPGPTEDHASSSLRSALARLHGGARAAVEATAQKIGLTDQVTVDLWDSRELHTEARFRLSDLEGVDTKHPHPRVRQPLVRDRGFGEHRPQHRVRRSDRTCASRPGIALSAENGSRGLARRSDRQRRSGPWSR